MRKYFHKWLLRLPIKTIAMWISQKRRKSKVHIKFVHINFFLLLRLMRLVDFHYYLPETLFDVLPNCALHLMKLSTMRSMSVWLVYALMRTISCDCGQ